MIAENKKLREKTLDNYRTKALEKKDLAEKVEKRVSIHLQYICYAHVMLYVT